MTSPDAQALRDLLDHHAIESLLKRYARALDQKDYDALGACFSADAWLDYTAADGIAGHWPEIRAWLEGALAPIEEMQHFTTNVEVSLDGDSAEATSYTLNVNGIRLGDGELRHMVVGAHYADRLVRTGEGWRIQRRVERRLTTFGHRFGPGS